MPRRIALSIIFILAFAPLAHADYHYASHNGSNEYPYTSWETAADSVQKAINAATAGDTIYVGSGVWSDMSYVLHDSLSLVGRGIDSTILRHENTTGRFRFIWANNENLIANFTFDGTNREYNNCAIEARLRATNLIVKEIAFTNLNTGLMLAEITGQILNNIFTNNDEAVNANWGDCSMLVQNNTFTYNLWVFDDAGGNLIMINNIFALNRALRVLSLNVRTSQDVYYIANNLIYRNQEDIDLQYIASIITGGPSYYVNNTIVGPHNYYAQEGIGNWGIRHEPVISVNNVVNNFFQGYYNDNGDSTTVRYGCTWNNRFDSQGYVPVNFEIGNIQADPMFANLDSGDVHLQAYSPLIDAGDPEILDVDGTRSDIGCYGGPGGCSYVYLDLAPQIPDSISAHISGDTVNIIWRRNYEADFNRYQIYRDTVAGFTPSIHNMIAEPETSFYQDIITNPYSSYYYKMTSVDNQHNVSDYSDELAVIFSGIPPFSQDGLPRYAVISTAYPNPFNSQINIVYSASNLGPQPPEIKLEIFDIQGRVVRTLVNERKPCGTYRVIWDGRDDNGEQVASGSYLARVSQWGMSGGDFPIKITLVK